MNRILGKVLGVLLGLVLLQYAEAQHAFTDGAGLTYTQNFDAFSPAPPADNSQVAFNVSGWSFSETGSNANTNYRVHSGGANTGDTYSFGTTAATDRALGEICSGSLISTFGIQFTNNATQHLIGLNFNFNIETWRRGTSAADRTIFEWSTDATSLTTGTWNAVSALDLYTPNTTGAEGARNGNDPAFRVNITHNLSGAFAVSVGNTIWIRWRGQNDTGNDDGNAIDDLTITAVTGAPPTIPATFNFATATQSVLENAGTLSVQVNSNGNNNQTSSVDITASAFSTATAGDYTITTSTLTFPAGSTMTQNVSIDITDDMLSENAEYVVLTFSNLVNANAGTANRHYLYIRDNDRLVPAANDEVLLTLVGSFSNGTAGSNSAEIATYDSASKRIFIANSIGGKVDIVDFSNPAAPSLVNSVSMSGYGGINSVVVRNGVVACAVENTSPQAKGWVLFFDTNGVLQDSVGVGAMPDMITFNHAGTKILTANEGEPNTTYTNDPEGSISIIDLTPGIGNLSYLNVTTANFNAFDAQAASLKAAGVRLYATGSTVSQDLEPEYITISEDDNTAWVTLQENNAIAVVNLTTNTVSQIMPLGYSDHSLPGNGLDASDQSVGINIANYPIKGMYQPDAMASYQVGANTYLVLANEGDAREYAGLTEVVRLSAANLDSVAFPYFREMKNANMLGRLNITDKWGDTDNDGDLDEVYAYGSRSFSIVNAATGTTVFNSGDELEWITANHPTFGAMFNASNAGTTTAKNRSDDKGPEPEGVALATIEGKKYAFIALERIGGVMVYNIENPAAPTYVGYYNNRDIVTNGPDRGAEGIIFITADQSPDGNSYVILANEVSSTLSIFRADACAATPIALNDTICPNNTATLMASGAISGRDYKWYDAATAGNLLQTNGNSFTTPVLNSNTDYYVSVYNTTLGCESERVKVSSIVNPYAAAPTLVNPVSSPVSICMGSSITLEVSNAANTSTQWRWFSGAANASPILTSNGNTLVLANQNSVRSYYAFAQDTLTGCWSQIGTEVRVNLNSLPNALAGADRLVCPGGNTLVGPAAVTGWTYSWAPSSLLSSTTVSRPTVLNIPVGFNQNYVLTVTNAQGCSKTDTVNVAAHDLSALQSATNAGSDATVCSGVSAQLGSAATAGFTYTWTPFAALSNRFAPNPIHLFNSPSSTAATTTNYILTVRQTGTGCTWKDTTVVVTNPLPAAIRVNAGADQTILQGASTTIGGANAVTGLTYSWSPVTGLSNPNIAKPSASPTTTTTYTLTVSNAFGCNRTDNMLLTVVPVRSGDKGDALNVVAYPNPVKEVLHLQADAVLSGKVSVLLLNELGQQVLAKELQLTESVLNEDLNVSMLAPGIYTVAVRTEAGEFVFKVVKE